VRESPEAPDGVAITGGAITALGDWAPQQNVAGVFLSPTAAS
jgi:hypothetical protein